MNVVLDTGVVLSSLLFPAGRLAWMPIWWKDGRLTPLASRETTQEFIRALAYPKFALDEAQIQVVLGKYLPWVETVTVDSATISDLPHCRDPHDQMFLQLALAGDAEALVTGDGALQEMAELVPFRILTPAALRAWCEGK